ncbi:MAG: DNA polymerase III subunit gamma/tau [Pygmaiobacter sp.]|nr:DNA polymerase III subunit gamma/tau [Pygmaiobacter sp.]
MYHALYRKYRPKTFGDVYGQEAITAALKNQVATGHIGHAYLFTGTRGTGKTSCAKILAKAVNCLNPQQGEPCGECDICRGLEEGSILDVSEIDAASNTGIDDIRALREEAVYTPANCRYKVYIIDEVHMLSNSAFNALLKIMEEPPAHVIFILATTEIQKVPSTILSRCQRYDFGRIPQQTIQKRLQLVAEKENITLSDGAAALVAQLADGALRDGLSILDTCASAGDGTVDEALVRRMAGVTDKSYLFDLSGALTTQDTTKALGLVAALRQNSIDMKRLCEELIAHYRTIMLLGAGAGDVGLNLSPEDRRRYEDEAKRVSLTAAVYAMRVLGESLDKMSRGTDPRIELELALFALCGTTAPAAPVVPQQMQQAPAPVVTAQPVQPTAQPVPPAEPAVQKPAAPIAAPTPAQSGEAEEEQPCAFWPAVIALAQQKDPMAHGFLVGSQAYVQGRRVLIDGSATFLRFMKTNQDSAERLKTLIFEASGEHYSIGPYQKKQAPAATKKSRAEETFQQLEDAGVPVEYI